MTSDAPQSPDRPPVPAVAVSPSDQSSDREQSDADQAGNLDRNLGDRAQSDADQALNAGKLDRLVVGTDKLTESNDRLALAMTEYQERARLAAIRFRITMGALGLIVIVMLAAIGYVLGKVDQSVAGSVGARAEIISCVTPGQPCYDTAQVRSGREIGSLIAAIAGNDQRVAARAAACAPDYVNLPSRARTRAIYQCIVRSHPR